MTIRFSDWLLSFVTSKNAILVLPDYRLLPTATGLDILEDLRDFYTWLFKPGNLQSHLPDGVTADLDHILVGGESAGGYLALQSALQSPSRERTAAVSTVNDDHDDWLVLGNVLE